MNTPVLPSPKGCLHQALRRLTPYRNNKTKEHSPVNPLLFSCQTRGRSLKSAPTKSKSTKSTTSPSSRRLHVDPSAVSRAVRGVENDPDLPGTDRVICRAFGLSEPETSQHNVPHTHTFLPQGNNSVLFSLHKGKYISIVFA
jgi:hypothetical protein